MKFIKALRGCLAIVYAISHLFIVTFPGFLIAVLLAALTSRGNGTTFRNRLVWHTTGHGALLFWILRGILGVEANIQLLAQVALLERRASGASQSLIVIANHQSIIDILIVCTVMWRLRHTSLRWILKVSLRWTPFGIVAWLSRCGFVRRQREKGQEDLAAVALCGKQAFQDNATVVIFPEGTRFTGKVQGSEFEHLRRPKQGGFRTLLAQMPEAGVLSIAIHWSGGARGEGFGRTFWDGLDFVGRRLDVRAEYIPRAVIDADSSWLNTHWHERDLLLADA
ncbi:1-acyl-sn-glycerol-3-phosphate acyltransferase [Patescibacteria group bacterium]|nr:1-acyl-sn-glycerol-3-phosphate acyltransferase [Patescibacteria group bacterium]